MYDWIGSLVTLLIIAAIAVLWYFTCGRHGRCCCSCCYTCREDKRCCCSCCCTTTYDEELEQAEVLTCKSKIKLQ
ncbi:hypothetical protein ACHWQZ_G015590 [Mnemiopsis leidyi]